MKDKGSLREHFLRLLKEQGSAQRADKSQQIAAKLFALPAYRDAVTVMFYASLPGEVDTFAMMRQAKQTGKKVALPVITKDKQTMVVALIDSLEDLQTGPFGILSPEVNAPVLDVSGIDAVVVPGVAFDASNHRLGRGAGYYDRFLSTLPDRTKTIGVAFDFQLVPALPVEPHDIALDCLITA